VRVQLRVATCLAATIASCAVATTRVQGAATLPMHTMAANAAVPCSPAVPVAVGQAIPGVGTLSTLGPGTCILTLPTTNGYFFARKLARTNNVGSATLTVGIGADLRFALAVTSLVPNSNFLYVCEVTNAAIAAAQTFFGYMVVPSNAPQSGEGLLYATVPTLTASDPIVVSCTGLFEAESAADPLGIDESGTASFVATD